MSEWEPATEAEVAMRDALRANDQEQYFRILARTDVLLPIAPDSSPNNEGGWGTWTTEGRTHVLAFTSPSALHECLAGHPGTHRRVPFRDLAGIWPNVEWWLAVNPGLPIEGYLPSWFVTQISRGDVRLPGRTLGARARIEQATSRTRAVAQVPLRTVPNQPAPTPIERQRMRADQGGPNATTSAPPAAAPAPPAVPPASSAPPFQPPGPYVPPAATPPAPPPPSTVPPRREVPPPDVAPPGAFLPTRADRPISFERTMGRSAFSSPSSPSGTPSGPLPAENAPTSGGAAARGRASFPGAASRGLFDGSDRKSLDVPGERELFSGLDRGGPSGRTDLPTRPQNGGAPTSGPPSRPMGGESGLPSRPSGLPSRPFGGESGLPQRPMGGDSGLPSRPLGGESGLPQRPLGGESGLPSRPSGGESGLPSRPLGGESGLPSRPLGGESGLPSRPGGGEAGRDEAGGDPRRYWPRREPARSLGEIYTEHAEPVIPAAWQPPPDLPLASGPPLPTRQPQATRPEPEPPAAYRPGGPLPSRLGAGDALPQRPLSGDALPSRPLPGDSLPQRPLSGDALPQRPLSGDVLPQRPVSGEPSRAPYGEPSRPGAGEAGGFAGGESLPRRPGEPAAYRGGESVPLRPGLVDPGAFAAGDPAVDGPSRTGWTGAADVRPGGPGLAARSGGEAFAGEGRGPENGPQAWRGADAPEAPLPFDRPVFDRPGFSRLDVEAPEVDEAPSASDQAFGGVASGARSAGFGGANLDEHPFFSDTPGPGAGGGERGLFEPRPDQAAEPGAFESRREPAAFEPGAFESRREPGAFESRREPAEQPGWGAGEQGGQHGGFEARPESGWANGADQPAQRSTFEPSPESGWSNKSEQASSSESGWGNKSEQTAPSESGWGNKAEPAAPAESTWGSKAEQGEAPGFFAGRAEVQPSFFGEPGESAREEPQRPFFDDEAEPRAFNAFGVPVDEPAIRDPYAALADLRSEPDDHEEPAQASFASGVETLAQEQRRSEDEKENTGSFFLVPPERDAGVRADEEASPSLRTFFEDGAAERPDFQRDAVQDLPSAGAGAAEEPTFSWTPPAESTDDWTPPAETTEKWTPSAETTEKWSPSAETTDKWAPASEASTDKWAPAGEATAEWTPSTEPAVYHVEPAREPTREPVYEPEIVEDAPPVRLHDEIVDAEVVTPAVKAAVPDFRPANTVEQDLFEAAQANSTDRFLSTLLLAKVLIPFWTGDGPIEPANFRTEHMNGLPHLIVFTSPERMQERLGADAQGSWIKFTRLIRHWPPGDQLAFAINPESPAGAVLPGTEVVQLATWATEMGLGVDDPDDQPAASAPAAAEPERRPAYEPPASGREQVMQKPISPEQLSHYLERNYDRVSGFVHRAAEVGHLRTPEQLYNALGLGYAGSSFKPDADEAYVLRWIAYRGDLYRIPYGGSSPEAMRAMEGWVIERPPFRGNGFAPSETGDVIAEFKVDSARLPHDAELWRLRRDGQQELIARLDADGPAWRRA
ncbi:SseB family protein [Dactylosporangium sp. CA-139066]|uniref:SseB family protein n=1 Tax=Dactylosporangium sp. CA-139066 TaxID=3239930 RepID=UPI003D8E0717